MCMESTEPGQMCEITGSVLWESHFSSVTTLVRCLQQMCKQAVCTVCVCAVGGQEFTSNLWLVTFLPFLLHVILGSGSPVA